MDQLNKKRIDKLTAYFESYQVDGFIIPSNDEFQSEYVQECYNRLNYITGFTGSNGVAIITKTRRIFFTDGRYLLQAGQDLPGFEILDLSKIYEIKLLEKIGFDPKLFTVNGIEKYKHLNLIAVTNIVDQIWQRDKDAEVETFFYKLQFAGQPSNEKCNNLKRYLKDNNLDAFVITDSTNISWLLNIRSKANLTNPILLSNLIFYQDGLMKLFSSANFMLENLCSYSLNEFETHLGELKNKKVSIDPNSASVWIKEKLIAPEFIEDPCTLAKAQKNDIEQQQARRINKIDSIALIKFFYWLERIKNKVSELEIAEKLLEFRKQHHDFIAPSFNTICGFNSNGAIIHYRANEKTNKKIKDNGLLLIDSGGHYYGGTTDVTRVMAIGKVSQEQKLYYTLVLKGHIAIAQAKFPIGTRGADLDVLARQFLWKYGKDYPHGTGHGVGNFLSVHEGPQRIGKLANQKLLPGMILSNEPGFYKENEYGIRIENLLLVKQKENFLYFETLTLVPMEKKLILKGLLSKDEIRWLNNYHQNIYKKIAPSLTKIQQTWLQRKTAEL